MTPEELDKMFPPLEWRQADPAHSYPLECHIGNAVTTITADEVAGDSPLYNVTWSLADRTYVVRHVPPALAKFTAELQARVLWQKLNRPPRSRVKGNRS